MTMKKKVLTTLSVVLILGLAALGILAYLTDTDSDVNVMTLGNVDIEQEENFVQDSALDPGVTVTKEVTVTNVGESDAYVRTWFAFENPVNGIVSWEGNIGEYVGDANIDGTSYSIYCLTYGKVISGEEVYSLKSVTMSKTASNADVAKYGDTYEVLVFSQAGQVTGFADDTTPAGALDIMFGSTHPWADVAMVDTDAELVAAIAEGGDIVLTDDITLNDNPLTIKNDVVLHMGGNTIDGIATNASASCLINVKSGATLTLKGDGIISAAATTPDTNWGGEGQPAYPGYASNTIKNEGKLIVDGVTIKNITSPGGASYAIDNYQGSELIVNDGVIDGVGKCAIRMFCNSNTLSTDVTINGGTITGKRAIWVQLPGSNINNVRPVKLTITGGKLICTDTTNDVCIYSYSYGDSFAGTYVNISGGEFTGDVAFGGGNAKTTQENVTITGGTFHGLVGRYLENNGWEDIAH